MKTISEILDHIIQEWAFRVPTGMPDAKNSLHLVELRNILNELKLPSSFSQKFIENLSESGVVVGDTVVKARKKSGP